MAKVNLTFEMNELAQATPEQIEAALNNFEVSIGKTFPQDYRDHMLVYNGGDVLEDDIKHKNYDESGGGSYFYSVGIGDYTLEEVYNVMANNNMLPVDYIPIGLTNGGENHYVIK